MRNEEMSHATVSREQWIENRKQLLIKEKEFTKLQDDLTRLRRDLPWVKVEKEYVFDTPAGPEETGRALRRTEPINRLSLHVRTRMERRMSWMLILRRPRRWAKYAHLTPRR